MAAKPGQLTARWMRLRLIVIGLALAASSSCSDSSAQSEQIPEPRSNKSVSDSKAFRICRTATFQTEDGLAPAAKDHVSWPDLISGSVKIRRISDRAIVVEARDVVVDYQGVRSHVRVDCSVSQSQTGRWTGGARVSGE